VLGLSSGGLWWGIAPVSAGVFGVPAGVLATFLASLAWPEPTGTEDPPV